MKRCQGHGWSPHSCSRLQSPAGRSQTGSLAALLLLHSPIHSGLRPPLRERARNTQRHYRRDKGKGAGRETERLGEMRKEKKPDTLTNLRNKRTASQQTKWSAEEAKEGPEQPLRRTRLTEPAGTRRGRLAGRGGGSTAAPGPLSRPLCEPHFTPRRPRPRLCGAGNTPCRPDRTCSFLATPSLPRSCPPPRGLEDPPRSGSASWAPGPTAGRGWRGRPKLGRAKGKAGGLQMGLRSLSGEVIPSPGP